MARSAWYVIIDFPNYEINRMGQVRSRKTMRLLTLYDDGKGYLRIKLNGMNCRLQILVAKQFVPNPDPGVRTIVNHKKGNKYDCRASQLEWVTQSENIKHAWDTGLIKRKRKVNNYSSRKTV